jgi:phosphoribosylanthranilate isomerase
MAKIAVKICGLTNYNDAALAVKLGADYLGFIFAESPRKVTVEIVVDILTKLKENELRDKAKVVGVFVNEEGENIENIIRQTGIDIVQLSGDEKPADANKFAFPWYKVFRISSKEDVDNQIFPKGYLWQCNKLLVDTKVAGLYGGTGKSIDLSVAQYAKNRTKEVGKKFFLAGGINPENVYELITTVIPDGIDVGSGVEESKGRKSKSKMEKLFEEINRLKYDK